MLHAFTLGRETVVSIEAIYSTVKRPMRPTQVGCMMAATGKAKWKSRFGWI